jgi:threonyl-tRNA synthetase
VTLPDGKQKEGISFETTPMDIVKSISNSLAEKVVVAKVNYTRRIATLDEGLLNPEAEKLEEGKENWVLWDMLRPLEGDCDLKLIDFNDIEGKATFWHSSAHILGESLEREFGIHLCHGPPTESGFYYDCYAGNEVILSSILIIYRYLSKIIIRQ